MERLTEKLDQPYVDLYDNRLNLYEPKGFSTDTQIGACIDKLGKLEDLEEKLGCPLEVLSSIYNNGFYVDILDYVPPYRIYRIDIFKKEITFYDEEANCFSVKLCNYKKTWWLKEDRSE